MRFWKKTISVLLIHAFILSSLPAGVLQPVLAATPDNPAATDKETTTNPEDVIISKDYGIVKSKFVGKGDKLIVHIQDAHCNYEAQSNIAKIVENLVRNNTLSFVSVEGADGLIDTSWFKAFPDAEVRKEVANYFMKKGEITGPEFLSITTDYPIKLFGAETREYYIQNLNAFTASYPSKDETEKYLNGIKSVLNRLQNFIYNADLKAMDSKSREHESKAIQFNEYVRFLQSEAERHKINLRQYGNLFKLINVLIYEKKIDFSVTDKERSAVIDELSKALPKDALTELVNKSISFKVGKVSSSEYYEYLKSLVAKNGIELSKKYPNLSNYIIYNSVYSKIDNEKLFNDIKEVEAAIKEKLFENEDQRTLERLSRHIDTLLGLINIKLLNGEFEYFKTHKEEFAPESFTDFMKAKSIQFGLAYEAEPPSPAIADSILKLEDFYAIAIKRDKALVDNTLEGMKKYGQRMAVLVTGGFHSEGMAKLLEKQGISYVVVCPNITKDVPSPYIQVLTNQRTSFEDILAGPQEPVKQNMLAPALLSFGMELSLKESEEFVGLKDRTEIDRAAWMKKYSLSWLRKVFQYMGQHRMAHDKEVLRDAYIMAFKRSAKAVGLDANEIISPKIFDEAFDAAYSTLTVPSILDAARISQAKADLPSEFPADRYEWVKGPNGEDLTGIEIWDKTNRTIRFRQVGGEWSNYGGGMSLAQMQIDGVKIEIGINIPSVEALKTSDNELLLKNTETGKELNISIVKTTIAGVGTRFCMIGNRTYGVAGDTIVLSNLLRHDDAQDMLAWIGNQALLGLFGVKPWDILNITVDGRSSGARPYLFDTLQEPISRIANPEFFPPNPALEDLEAARKYLADTQYNKNASLGELITRLHYTAVLSRSNISVTGDYARVIEDLTIVTRNLLEMGLSNNQTVSKVAQGIFNSISLAVVKAEHPAKPELPTPELSSGELEKLLREEPFVIEDPDKDFPRLQAVVTSLILEGKWKPYILVNIKDFSGSTYAAYVKFVEAVSRKYNGNITFILSVENSRALKGDLAGTYTARRRAIDALGDDFWLNERVITEPDGGEKVRAANAGVAYEQWSKTLTTDGNSFLEDNILTGSAMWLLLPKLGKGKNGQNYKPWLASDGRIRFGRMNLGGKPLSQIPDDLELAACGLDALVMTQDQMAFIRTRVSEKASRLNKNISDIFEDELEEILYNTPVGVEIRANIDKRELIKRGIFVVGENRVMSGFLEKGGGEKLATRKRYVNLASIAYKSGNGKVLENLWFILEDSRTSLDIIKRFATTRTVPASKEEFIGRVPAVSSFQEIFQGFIYRSVRPWAEQVAQALGSKKLYGISYGEGAQAADIASVGNYFEMWERYVREYKGDKEVDLDVAGGVTITYRGDKDKLKYLLRNVKIIGSGTLEIGDGVLIQGGTIAVNGALVIPDRTKIIDSQLLGDLEFKNEAAMVLASSLEPNKYIFHDNGKQVDKLVIYGDETITTQTYLDGKTHIVRFVNSFDYKGKIYQVVGGQDRWAAIRDKFALYGKMYENFDDVSRMRLDDVIKTEDQWVQLVKFIFTPTLSMEELYRVNAVISNLGSEYAAKKIDYQTLEDKIADVLKTMVSARFTLTDQKVFQDGVNNILGIVTKPSGTWSHQDIDEIIAQSYRRRAAPQIAEALKSVTYANVKEEPYCKALYRILASMHPAIITDVDHGPLAWNEIGAQGEEKTFFDLSLYGGDMSHGDAKRATDSFAMAWILATRAVPASTHVDFDTPIGLYGSAQGAITINNAELTPEQKIEVNEKIRADFESGRARLISFVAYAGGVDIYEIPSLEDAAYLLAHPGRGGDVCDHSKRRIYMSPSRLNWYNELGPAARLEFLNHEIAHINNPDWDEARVTEAAGIGLVLAAVIEEDINTKIGSVSLRDVLDNPNGAFDISVPEIIKLYGSNIKWAIDRMRKSTAGTRGILDKDDILGGPQLNAAVVTFMAQGYADYINANFPPDERGAFIGFDPRYFSKEFAWLFTRVLLANGIKVYRDINEGYSQTPVTSYMAYHLKIACGIEITSSHNPPNQNGIKSMTWYGGVDTDDVSAKIAAHIQRMYDQGLAGKGVVKMAPYDASRIMTVDAKKIYYDTYMSRLFDEKTATTMKAAMDSGARFIFDGLYGVGGPSMDYYLDRIFAGYDWRGKIIIMNASPDPSIGGIERPDPSKPRTMEVSGVLEKLASTSGVLIAVTADMDADRIGTAVIIPEKDVARAKRYGLFVSRMEFAGSVVNIVRFTPNQIFTLISYERVLQAYERKIGTRQFDEIKRAIAEGRAPELYLLTSIPSSLIAKQMMETFGGKSILTTVGFKNLGYEAEKLDRERPDAVVVSLLEESGGANIGPFTKDSRGSGIHRDKDTIALALALFASASELSLEKKNMLDLYVDMAEKLGGLFYYERIDAYLPNQSQAESLLEADQKLSEAVKEAFIGRYRAIDHVKERGASQSNLDDPKNIAILAELFGKRLEDITAVEERPVANTVLLIGEGNDWQHVQPVAKRFTFKDKEVIEVFHTGRSDQEGPSIAIYDAAGNFKARALLRASGTENLVKAYLEIFEPQSNPHPENLYVYFMPLLRYLGLQNYSMEAQGRDYISEYIETVKAKYGVSEKRFVPGSTTFEAEKAGAVKIGQKLHTPLDSKGDKALAASFLKSGYNKEGKTANIGYGVKEKAVIDGSFAIEGEGDQGYYIDQGRQFLATVKDMRDFFARRAQILGKPIKYVIKPGIGGQHTPFQGIAEVFQVIDAKTGVVVGEYELGKNYEEALGKVLAENGADWDQIAVIPSSKSGSTDETMMVFSEILYTLLKKIAEKDGLNGEQFAGTVFKTLHDINFENGAERKGADLFKGFSLALLTDKLNAVPGFKTDYEQVRGVFRIVLGNMFFETTNRPEQSRLSAFIQNSGLDKELGEKYAPGFGAMFDNVGGRWTADLHMMTFLAYHNMTDEQIQAYWQSRYNGIKEVRNGTHLANSLANKILDEGITDIALVVPDELFWFGKAMEQNFNESIWQEGFANLVAVKASMWEYQKPNYANKPKRLVVDITGTELDMEGCDLFKVPALYSGAAARTKKNLATELGRLFTTFYGNTYLVGNRLITRALAREGYTWADVDINDLNNPATRIVQRNLYLRQPYVELGKGLLEEKLGDLQKAGPEAIQAEVAKIQDAARHGKLISNIEGLGLPDNVTDMQALAQTILKAVKFAEKEDRKFVPFIYLEGEKFYGLREALTKLGIEWVMQGTGDQHISYQQVLSQPQKYLPFIISFVPEKLLPSRPAIGFAKGYLDNASSNMVRDLFAEASYRALTEPRTNEAGESVRGATGIFLRMQDSQESRAMLAEAFEKAVKVPPEGIEAAVGTKPAEVKRPGLAREEYIYNTYVENDAAALHQTLVGLGVNTEWTKNKRVLILYDTAIDPVVDTAHVARAGEVAVNKYMNGAIIEVRGTGKALYDAAKVQAINLAATDAIVTIAGDATLKEIGAEGLKDLGKVINVQNPDNRYIPVIGLYDLALRIAYDLGDEKILECLDRIAINDPENPTPWTSADIRKGVIIILPRIRPVDMAEAVEAYKAAQAALASL